MCRLQANNSQKYVNSKSYLIFLPSMIPLELFRINDYLLNNFSKLFWTLWSVMARLFNGSAHNLLSSVHLFAHICTLFPTSNNLLRKCMFRVFLDSLGFFLLSLVPLLSTTVSVVMAVHMLLQPSRVLPCLVQKKFNKSQISPWSVSIKDWCSSNATPVAEAASQYLCFCLFRQKRFQLHWITAPFRKVYVLL